MAEAVVDEAEYVEYRANVALLLVEPLHMLEVSVLEKDDITEDPVVANRDNLAVDSTSCQLGEYV